MVVVTTLYCLHALAATPTTVVVEALAVADAEASTAVSLGHRSLLVLTPPPPALVPGGASQLHT